MSTKLLNGYFHDTGHMKVTINACERNWAYELPLTVALLDIATELINDTAYDDFCKQHWIYEASNPMRALDIWMLPMNPVKTLIIYSFTTDVFLARPRTFTLPMFWRYETSHNWPYGRTRIYSSGDIPRDALIIW